MVDAINITNAAQVGRADVRGDQASPVAYTGKLDFATNPKVFIDFTTINQSMQFGIPKTLFIDNGNNPYSVVVNVSITQQEFTIPAYAAGFFPINATTSSDIILSSDAGAPNGISFAIHNVKLMPLIWYSYGAFNTNRPIKAQGTMQEGATVATESANMPVYMGGIDRATGLFHGIKVDSQGRLDFASTITLGAVTIADGADVAEGNTNDAPVTNPANPATVIALLKGVLTAVNAFNNGNTAPANSAITSVASSVASTQALAANTNRKGAVFYNNSTSVCYLALANVDAAVNYSIAVPAYSSFILGNGDYTGRVNVAWQTATGNLQVTEIS